LLQQAVVSFIGTHARMRDECRQIAVALAVLCDQDQPGGRGSGIARRSAGIECAAVFVIGRVGDRGR
jgi:hypothetical protein